jgi:hypothetical protein
LETIGFWFYKNEWEGRVRYVNEFDDLGRTLACSSIDGQSPGQVGPSGWSWGRERDPAGELIMERPI